MSRKTQDQLSEELCQRFVNETDKATLDAGLSLDVAAQICREISSEFRDRANMFEAEVEAERNGS